jgi:hypothetical protein
MEWATRIEAIRSLFTPRAHLKRHHQHETVFSGLKICKMALSNQIDFLVFFSLRKMTYRNFINSVRWLYAAKFEKIDFLEMADSGKSM